MTTTNTTKAPRITKRDRFNELLTMIPADRADLIDFVNHELELLDKKNNAEKKPTKAQQEAAALADTVAEVMENMTEALTVSDIQAMDERISAANFSNQKIAAIMRRLVAEGRAVKVEAGRKSLFKLAD